MTSISIHRPDTLGSATIYHFPVGGRAGLAARGELDGNIAPAPASNEFVLTDAWYHQEAIRDARQATKQ